MKKKRFLAVILALTMVLGLLPTTVFAAGKTPFTDVTAGYWAEDEIAWAYENGYMNGTGGAAFSPNGSVTRQQLWMVLARLSGAQPASMAEAGSWAVNNAVSDGSNPARAVTRQQMVTTLYRWTQQMGYSVEGAADLTAFPDFGTLEAYAQVPMAWAVSNGIVNGTTQGTLASAAPTSRAQFAVILHRFHALLEGSAAPDGEYTVTFMWNYSGKGAYKTVTVSEGKTVKEPADPTRSGYTFKGWYTKSSGGSAFDFDSGITKDITLYARWAAKTGGGSSGGSSGGGTTHTHSWGGWTSNGNGTHTRTCVSGDASETVNCTYGAEVTWNNVVEDPATEVKESKHTHACTVCGYTEAVDCTFDEGVSETVTDGTTEITTTTYTCTSCNASYATISSADYKILYVSGDTKILGNDLNALLADSRVTADGTITLFDDLDVTAQITVNKAVTINGNGKTITVTSDLGSTNGSKMLMDISAGATVTNVTLNSNNYAYGLQAYRAGTVTLTNVTLQGSKGAGLTVNGSTVNASGLDISGSAWGCVNVDPGTGVTELSSFTMTGTNTLTAGDGKPEIWADAGNTLGNGDGEVYVSAEGYYPYHLNDNNVFVWLKKTVAEVLADSTVTSLTMLSDQTVNSLNIGNKTLKIADDVDLTVDGTVTGAGKITNVTGDVEYIYNADQLTAFGTAVNGGDKYAGKTVKLMADIDLEGVSWTPIGNVTSYPTITFAGTFDGDGHTISNLTTSDTTANCASAGLFGSITGQVKNVTLKDVNVTSSHYAGALVGYSSANVGMKIENCHVDGGTITSVPERIGDSYGNGDKAGGIIGYCVAGDVVTGCSVKNVTITAYRDLGGIVGCAAATVTNNSVENVTLIQDDTNGYKAELMTTVGAIIGRNITATTDSNTDENVTIIHKLADGSTYTDGLTLTNDTTISGENIRIAPTAEGTSAITIDGDVTLTIEGSVTLIGAKDGDGIEVPEGSSLTLTGTGTLVAKGNAGYEYADTYYNNTSDTSYSNTAGSGIGNAGEAVGAITITGLTNLTAEGYGVHAFGIGGDTSEVTIENTTIEYARGGFAKSTPGSGDSYAKGGEGGAAIGTKAANGVVALTDVAVKKAEGGAKCAAIGGFYHVGVTVNISDCTLEDIIGGHSAAAIGGGRATEDEDDRVVIVIEDSVIEAQGGYYGAGIGSGYDTKCSGLPSVQITITGDSEIAAVGGKYAAGIGTGYHVGKLAGSIADTVDTTGTSANADKFYKANYTTAQDIGYSVVDPKREAKDLIPTFTVAGEIIDNPVDKIQSST